MPPLLLPQDGCLVLDLEGYGVRFNSTTMTADPVACLETKKDTELCKNISQLRVATLSRQLSPRRRCLQYHCEAPDQCNIIADYPGGPSVVMTNSLSNHLQSDTMIRGTDGLITWAMLQGGKEYGVRIVPFGKGKKRSCCPGKAKAPRADFGRTCLTACGRVSSRNATSPWRFACRLRSRWGSSRIAKTRWPDSTRPNNRSCWDNHRLSDRKDPRT